jgi:large subunit ribosomal protein L7/L12
MSRKNQWDLILVNHGHDRIGVMSEIRKIVGCDASEARKLIDSAPVKLIGGLTDREAFTMKAALEEWGAEVKIGIPN